MTVLAALARRSVENPQVPLTSTSLVDYLSGGSASAGVSVNEKRVYGLTAYYRGIALTASTMAGLPFKVYRRGSRERVLQRTVLDNPNPRQTPFEFWQTIFANAVGWGNAYAHKVRSGDGATVRAVWPIHPSAVSIELVEPSDRFPDGKVFRVADRDGRERVWSNREMFHLPYLSPHGVEGLRPLQLAREVLGISIAAEKTAAGFFGKGSMLSGILHTDADLSQEQADALKTRWKQKLSGPSNAGDIAVLDNGAKFSSVAIPPADAELLATRKFTVTEIARLIGCPPHLLNDVEKSTSWGTGIEQQFIGWVQVTLDGWLTLAAQRVTRELLPGGWTSGIWYAEHVLEGLLRGDSKARAAFYHQAVHDGWMNRNEVRDRENLEPEDGLDEFLIPSNLTLISVDGKLVPLSADGIEGDD